MQYRQKLEDIEKRFEELTSQMADPAVINDPAEYRKVTKAQSELQDVVGKFREWKKADADLAEAKSMLGESDAALRGMAEEEVARLEPEITELEHQLKILLLPKDPNDDKNILLEIRAGTGGDEATLFAAEVFRMYTRFAETRRWHVEVTSASDSPVGGVKEVIALVSGDKVYSQLKYESGVHRVQRVPETEQQGRVQVLQPVHTHCPRPLINVPRRAAPAARRSAGGPGAVRGAAPNQPGRRAPAPPRDGECGCSSSSSRRCRRRWRTPPEHRRWWPAAEPGP